MNANHVSLAVPPAAGSVRLWLRSEGAAVLLVSLLFYWHAESSWWIFFALLLTPDLSMLGYLANPRIGAVAYNLIHSYFLPLGLAAIAVMTNRAQWLPYLLIWTAHVGIDRLLGYGLKYPTGFAHTHLGTLGR